MAGQAQVYRTMERATRLPHGDDPHRSTVAPAPHVKSKPSKQRQLAATPPRCAMGAAFGRRAVYALCVVLAAIGTPPGGLLENALAQSAEQSAEPAAQDASQGETAPASAPPNIIIYVIDTLRADRLGLYGYDKPTSPRLDALAAECVVFEQAYAPAPWTLPSLASILTSKFPCEHLVLTQRDTLDPAIKTLTQRLKNAGYTTCGFCANVHCKISGLDRGFDFYKGLAMQGPIMDFWIDGLRRRPYYVYIHTMEPHDTYRTPARLIKRFGNVPAKIVQEYAKEYKHFMSLPPVDFEADRPVGTTDNTAEQQEALAHLNRLKPHIDTLYDASVFWADRNLGSVIDAIKKRDAKLGINEWDNTLLIVTADHGEALGEHGYWLHDHSAYEELMRVPLMIKFPNGEYAGTRVKDVVSLVDLVPTLAEVLNKPEWADGASGHSLMPFVRGEESRPADRSVVPGMRMNVKKYYKPSFEQRGNVNVVVRRGDFKGILNVERRSFELYDLANDPAEKNNLAENRVAVAAAMKMYAELWFDKNNRRPRQGADGPVGVEVVCEKCEETFRWVDPIGNLTLQDRRQMESLGYLQSVDSLQRCRHCGFERMVPPPKSKNAGQ